jgi:mannose/cellobiose epimerase-like protein (N-acyl-D-glucosamine 2-epimerase family)
MSTLNSQPEKFADIAFQRAHIEKTMAFYDGRCVDPQGGFYHFFLDDGQVYNKTTRHLVSSTRFVINYAKAARFFNRPDYLALARHGLHFIERAHYQKSTGGYAWLLENNAIADATNYCYGAAFVLLCYAEALKSGISEALQGVEAAYNLLDKRFWREADGLFVDEYDATFAQLSAYRGQNANMHSCEALICAYQATGDQKFLRRAQVLAESVTGRLASLAGEGNAGLVWEHYNSDWQIDWNYNFDNPKHLFRPWGFQPGHQTEWAKLLLTLNQIAANPVYLTRAKHLFDTAVARSWDSVNGGLVYGLAPDGKVCDGDKYFWVQAESFAAAAMLAEATGAAVYWDWVEKIWGYSWAHMIDHEHGAWYRILTVDNKKYSNEKSPAGKTDYHTMGASFELIEVLQRGAKK